MNLKIKHFLNFKKKSNGCVKRGTSLRRERIREGENIHKRKRERWVIKKKN